MNEANTVRLAAPDDDAVVEYDRRHLALYAALLEADDAGQAWQKAAATVLGLDPGDERAERCWRSHLERARWIVGDGLERAITVFSQRVPIVQSQSH